MRRRIAWVALVAMLVGTAALVVVTARARRRRWERAVDQLCACGAPTRLTLQSLARTAGGGLDGVARAELASLADGCEDLHLALARRRWSDELRRRPMRVTPSARHLRDHRAITNAFAVMCGEAQQGFWQRLGDRLTAPSNDPPDVVRIAREHLRVRDGMCMRQRTLATEPEAYTLSITEAEHTAEGCEQAPR